MVHVPIIQSVIWTCTCISLICFFNSVTVHIPIVYFFSLFAILCIKLILKTYEEMCINHRKVPYKSNWTSINKLKKL